MLSIPCDDRIVSGGTVEDVVWPLGRQVSTRIPPPAPVADLRRATVGFLWDYVLRGDEIWASIRPELAARFPGVQLVGFDVFGNLHGPDEERERAALPGRLAATRVDSVIVATGA
jgi:hypothetical protein